jgi:hypothetical protein
VVEDIDESMLPRRELPSLLLFIKAPAHVGSKGTLEHFESITFTAPSGIAFPALISFIQTTAFFFLLCALITYDAPPILNFYGVIGFGNKGETKKGTKNINIVFLTMRTSLSFGISQR